MPIVLPASAYASTPLRSSSNSAPSWVSEQQIMFSAGTNRAAVRPPGDVMVRVSKLMPAWRHYPRRRPNAQDRSRGATGLTVRQLRLRENRLAVMSATPSVSAEGLLERAGNLSALGDLLAGVRASREGHLALLGGEAGVSKTALLRAFCASQSERLRILWGTGEPLYTPHPLGPLLDVAEATGGRLAELVEAAAKPHEVASALLAELRAQPLTLLVLEDLHWADEATLDVIALLATRISLGSGARAGELPGR